MSDSVFYIQGGKSVKKRDVFLHSVVFLLAVLLLCGCSSAAASSVSATPDPEATERSTVYVDSMDTVMELSAFGSNC